jgi:hypothetical protein
VDNLAGGDRLLEMFGVSGAPAAEMPNIYLTLVEVAR